MRRQSLWLLSGHIEQTWIASLMIVVVRRALAPTPRNESGNAMSRSAVFLKMLLSGSVDFDNRVSMSLTPRKPQDSTRQAVLLSQFNCPFVFRVTHNSGLVAYVSFGVSRQTIREDALLFAAVIGVSSL